MIKIVVDTLGTWLPTDSSRNWGIDGLLVDLDASTAEGPFYTIIENSDESLVIETDDDLSTVVNNQLIGVHIFERLNVTGGAQVDFGDDKVIVNDIANSSIDASSSVSADCGCLQGSRRGCRKYAETNEIA